MQCRKNSIFSPRHGLTAAHCVASVERRSKTGDVTAYRGLVDRCKDSFTQGTDYIEKREIVDSWKHPDWSRNDSFFDAAGAYTKSYLTSMSS